MSIFVHSASILSPYSVPIQYSFRIHSASILCPFLINSGPILCLICIQSFCVHYVSIPCPFLYHFSFRSRSVPAAVSRCRSPACVVVPPSVTRRQLIMQTTEQRGSAAAAAAAAYRLTRRPLSSVRRRESRRHRRRRRRRAAAAGRRPPPLASSLRPSAVSPARPPARLVSVSSAPRSPNPMPGAGNDGGRPVSSGAVMSRPPPVRGDGPSRSLYVMKGGNGRPTSCSVDTDAVLEQLSYSSVHNSYNRPSP